jgi:hypothetical protein
MKNMVPLVIGIAGIISAIATAIANVNGVFVGRVYWVPRLYGLSIVLFGVAAIIGIYNSKREHKPKPLVVPLRYGRSPFLGTRAMGHHGLVVVNHGEPAYDVSILPSEVQVGTSKLRFEGSKSTFTKADGDAFFASSIEISPGSSLLGGLFDEMRKQRVDSICVELIYKDAENHWYKTIGEIERDVNEVGGLSVKYIRQKRTKRP